MAEFAYIGYLTVAALVVAWATRALIAGLRFLFGE